MTFIIIFFLLSLFSLLAFIFIKNKKKAPSYVKHILFALYGIFFILITIFSAFYLKEKVTGNGKNSFIVGTIFLLLSYLNLSMYVYLPPYIKRKENLIKYVTFIFFTLFLFLSLFFFFRFGRLKLDNEVIDSSSSLLKIFHF